MTYSFSLFNSLPIIEKTIKLRATGHQRYHRSTLVENAPSKCCDSDWLSHSNINFEICVPLLLVHWCPLDESLDLSAGLTYGQHMSGRQNNLLTPCQKYRLSLFGGPYRCTDSLLSLVQINTAKNAPELACGFRSLNFRGWIEERSLPLRLQPRRVAI